MVEMIPSVQERKKNVHHFMNSYPYLCRLQNIVPNPNIKVDSSNNVLDFVGDRLKLDDWKPLLDAISNDRSLHFIRIRSRHSKAKVLEEVDTENQVRQNSTPKSSPLFTNFVLVKITEALSKCMNHSPSLTGLLLEKIPLNSNSLNHLTQGLDVCQNLQQLALPYTQIGDDGCAGLCQVLRRRLNLVWLNLTGCGISDKGVATLCNLLKFQKLNRYGESWKQSLRYRPVNPNIMPGLRRLTLNHNHIGDNGIKILVDTLVDDLWLKALDLQHCGVTMVGGEALLSLVKENQFLSVVDIRGNIQVPKSLVAAIVQQLAENNSDTTPEFQWLKEDNPKGTPAGSNSGTSISKSTQRLVSNTTLCSKGLSVLSILPNKTRIARTPTHSRSSSAKRTVNNTPRPPWNWNSSRTSLRRGNSDQLIQSPKKCNQEVMSELHFVKEQLQEVSQRLEEETERRVKIEKELKSYKKMMELPESALSVDNATLQNIFCQFYNAYLSKEKTPSHEQRTEDQPTLKKHDSIESVIKTVNGENIPGFQLDLGQSNSTSSQSSEGQGKARDAPSRAQLLFETLISS